MDNRFDYVKEAREVFDKEILALEKTRDTLDCGFAEILELLVDCRGKVIVTGIGKPGHVGTKIAATLASLGTPAFFLHPAEALHGDLGMVQADDVVLLTSYSGESEEIVRLLPTLHEIGCTTVAITGNGKSTLAKGCRHVFVFPEFEEACYMHLAPTSSTTALLVLGDALAVVASRARNFTEKDFGLNHPAGALGKKLLVKVRDLMYSGDRDAVVYEGSTLRAAIVEMSRRSPADAGTRRGCLQRVRRSGHDEEPQMGRRAGDGSERPADDEQLAHNRDAGSDCGRQGRGIHSDAGYF